jgi:hypothetical protein
MFTAGATAGTIAGATVLFSRPSYVRWVIAYTKAKAAARDPQGAGKLAASIAQLSRMAQSDPQLLPVLNAIAGNDAENQE